MKTRLLSILFVLASLTLIGSLSGPETTLADVSRQETGMIQCQAASRDALMTLEFPTAGGAVRGEYLVSYVVHDSSPLYDSDGTWDYYDEDRTVTQRVEISGFYQGGEEGSFSNLRVTGSGSANIDNLEDDRFDRSYSGEIDSPATATWGPGGTLTISGINAEMGLVSINATSIPNTEWLDPQGFNFPDPTMVCTPRPSVQTLEDIACVITTDPPELGERDTIFTAHIRAVGFDEGANLEYAGNFGSVAADTSVDLDPSADPVVRWGDATFAPGYYTLRAGVTDGDFTAFCSLHFTIGDVEPNNPPECLDVQIFPAAPPAGFPVLGAIVSARDADGDPLHYDFGILRGPDTMAEPSGVQDADNYIYSIPGGLQPGAYTVAVRVVDGARGEEKHEVICYLNFVVPPFPPGEEGGGCEPVAIIYLDDEGVEPNVVAIDAFIENTLAQGGPDLSLIVSHRQRLIDKFGQEGFEQVDGLLRNMGNIAETCPFILIVGDHDVVPFAVVPNPTEDGDVVFTDDVYGDTDHDALTVPDIPVARIPDGNSLGLLVTQLSPSSVPETSDFTVANTEWDFVEIVTSEIFGSGRSLLWSLPTTYTDVDASQVNVRYDYFTLHGSNRDTTAWFGESPTYPAAFAVSKANSKGVVLTGACYGAYTFGRTPENSITLAFLASGARAFVGSTGISYYPIWLVPPDPYRPMPATRFGALLHDTFLSALAGGKAPLAAFMEAKEAMANIAMSTNGTDMELKMVSEYVYYGKP
jgi:hypothetical protein